jgi:hypothetical protein
MRSPVAALAAVVVALAGCQAGPPVPGPYSTAQDTRCQLQARAATAANANAFTAGFEQGSLLRQCRELATVENGEAIGQRLGFRVRQGTRLEPPQRAAVAGLAEGCGVAEAAPLRAALETAHPAEWRRGQEAGRSAPESECAFARAAAVFMAQQQAGLR